MELLKMKQAIWDTFLTVLRHERCVTRPCEKGLTRWGMSLTTLKHRRCVKKHSKKPPQSLKYVPDWFVTHQKILRVMKHITGRRCLFENITEWYKGYPKLKAQKASIKEELLPIALHPSRWWGLVFS